MTHTDVKQMTAIIRAMRKGKWTDELPDWARSTVLQECGELGSGEMRAVQTAEAFIVLAVSCGYSLDEAAFLKECGFPR